MKEQVKTRPGKSSRVVVGKEIHIEAVSPGMHERAEGITSCTVWHITIDRQSGTVQALSPVNKILNDLGTYVKLPAEKLNIPEEAAKRYRQAFLNRRPDETAVFLNTRLGNSSVDVLLAVRYSKRWLELQRWHSDWRELGISRLDISEF
jgi:hypothetical protein